MKRFAILFPVLALTLLLLDQSAQGQNTPNTYIGSTTGSVLIDSNWSLGHVPMVSEDAIFNNGGGTRTLSNGSLTVGSWDILASGTYTIANGTNNTTSTLTLGGPGNLGNRVTGIAADLLSVPAAGALTLTGTNGTNAVLNLVLGQSGNFNAAGPISISSVISDGGNNFGLTLTGGNVVTLSGANTFGGGVTLSSGTLNLNNGAAPGTGNVTFNNSVIINTSAGDITLTNNNTQTWAGSFTFQGSNSLNLGTGPVTLTANNRFITVNNTVTVGGAIGDGGNGFSFFAGGTGTLILTGSSSYSGGTTLLAGVTRVSNIGNAGANGNLGRGTITFDGGTLLYAGAGETTNKAINLRNLGFPTFGGTIDTTPATGGLVLSGNVTTTGSGSNNLVLKSNNAGNMISGNISESSGAILSLDKVGSGTWTLAGTNSYSGGTGVSNGTLIVTSNGGLGSGQVTFGAGAILTLQGAATNYIGDSANLNIPFLNDTLNLNFTGSDTIKSLLVNGVMQPIGTYGGVGSGATFVLPELHGTGTLTVLTQPVPEPATYMLLGLGALVCARQFRSRKKT